MKQKVKSGIKIYLFLVLYLTVATVIYTIYINKTSQDFNLIAKLVIGGVAYMMLGFTYANAVHKKGLIIGLFVGILHFFLIALVYFLCTGKFEFQVLPFFICILLSGIGGMLGVNLKKLF
ncbi:MAG: TIGR04086 family membrane protein [Anaeroplasmataceae bacterium]|nr:TIGR04086 family membrane protein [Anaeroplasmataceae bacterium]